MLSKRKIFFRADAGQEIGYGHYIRSLALADMLKQDFDCTIFTQTPTEYQLREAEGRCPVIALPNDDSKFETFLEYLQGEEIVVLDNYFFTTDYQRAIKAKGCKLVCIDDLHDTHFVADLIINQAINVSPQDYSCESYTRFALGLGYSLLRRPFFEACEKREDYPAKVKETLDVVVAFGGSDCFNLTGKVIASIADLNVVNSITAIVGDAYSPEVMINSPKVQYRKNLSAADIAHLFSTSDVAILPASTMMNEALACGIKIIGGYFVPNQESDYHAFNRVNMIYGAGDFTEANALSKIKFLLNRITEKDGNTVSSMIPFRFVELFKSL